MDYAENSLCVLVSGDGEQRHAAFKLGDGGEPEFVHLAWHKFLRNESEEVFSKKGQYKYISFECPSFSEEEKEELISFIKTLWLKNRDKVPYSIVGDGSCGFFNLDGTMSSKEAGLGLTCATFVMSVFSTQGFPLLDESTWLSRPDDKVWHSKIIKTMEEYNVPREHIEAQKKYIGVSPRYRPEEVVGCAASYDYQPYSYCSAVSLGEGILAKMRCAGLIA